MKLILAAVAVCLANAASSLTTITFDHNIQSTSGSNFIGSSQGFLYDASFTYLNGNYLDLHSDSGILTSTIRAASGATFSPKSADVWGSLQIFKSGPGPRPLDDTGAAYYQWAMAGIAPVATLTFTGIKNGVTVATQSIGPTDTTPSNFGIPTLKPLTFASGFRNIDSLVLTVNDPLQGLPFWNDIGDPFGPNTVWCNDWCTSFRVDNMLVAPVPLPASGLLLIGGLMGLLGFRRFKAQ